MSHLSRCCAVIVMLCAGAPLLAADAARVDRFMDLTRMEQSMAQMPAMMAALGEQSLQQVGRENGLDEAQLARARALLQAQSGALAEALGWESLRPSLQALIAETFTDAELDAANAYYATELGQSMLDKQPELMQRAAQIGQQRMMALMPQLQEQTRRIVEEVQQ